MSRPCSVCGHHQRNAIDQGLAAGESYRRIAARFEIPASNLRRHAPHIRDTVRAAQQTAESARVLDIAKLLGAINAAALDALREARGSGDIRAQLMACSTVLRQCEFSHALDTEQRTEELWQRVEALEQMLTARGEVNGRWHSHYAG